MMPKTKSAAPKIYNVVRERIATFEYDSGMLLSEQQLANEFGVSRTPVREALHKLEQEKLVVISKSGAQVIPIDFIWIKNAYELRKSIDSLVADLAAKRASENEIKELINLINEFDKLNESEDISSIIKLDQAIHMKMISMSKNFVIGEMLEPMYVQFKRFWYFSNIKVGMQDKIAVTLRAEAQAIADHKPELAAKCAIEHIDAHMDQMRSILL